MNPLTVPPKKEKVHNLLISTVCGVLEVFLDRFKALTAVIAVNFCS